MSNTTTTNKPLSVRIEGDGIRIESPSLLIEIVGILTASPESNGEPVADSELPDEPYYKLRPH